MRLGLAWSWAALVAAGFALIPPPEPPDFRPYLLSTCQRLEERGQECQRTAVTTEDGYIVSLARLPSRGPPVLFIHGLLSASDQWLIYGRQHDLPSVLADGGFDVWLGDLRGNAYSRQHRWLSPETPAFWNFSFHEQGYYDLPAMLDHILEATGHPKVSYVGYSLGGTVFLVMGSTRPEYNSKVGAAALLAPYLFAPGPLSRLVTASLGLVAALMREWESVGEVFPRSNASLALNRLLCQRRTLPLCRAVYHHIFGIPSNLDQKAMVDVMSSFRAGSSAKTLYHCAQVMYSNSLRYYDYEEENMEMYGSADAPEYPLEEVTAPVSLHYSLHDSFVTPQNVDRLAKRLPNLIGKFVVPSSRFSHMDFMIGTHARKLVYQDIVNLIRKL